MDPQANEEGKSLLKQARKTYQNSQELLLSVEKGDQSQIQSLSEHISELEALSGSLYSKSSLCDAITNKKILQFIESCKQIKTDSERYIQRYQQQINQQREREQLLTNRKHGEFELDMGDEYDREMEMREKTKASLGSSNQMADAILASSYEVYEKLQSQNELLRGIRSRLLDLGGSIGISDQIMRTIGRRLSQDKWIVYGGMIGILILVIVLYYIFAG